MREQVIVDGCRARRPEADRGVEGGESQLRRLPAGEVDETAFGPDVRDAVDLDDVLVGEPPSADVDRGPSGGR